MKKALILCCIGFLSCKVQTTDINSGIKNNLKELNEKNGGESNMGEFVKKMREDYRAMIPMAGIPDPVSKVRSISIPTDNPKRSIPARLYIPEGISTNGNLPVILFIHGGGFVSGDLDTHEVLIHALANGSHALVLSVDYRLAPEYPFPSGLEDVYSSLNWLVDNANALKIDPKKIVVCGDSAGGNLATAVTILSRDRKGPKILAQWLMYPTVSNKMDTKSWEKLGDKFFPTREVNTSVIKAYVPKGISIYNPLIAPLWTDLRNLPPALIQVGELDPLQDECFDYGKALQKAGGEAKVTLYKGQQHGFIQFFKSQEVQTKGDKGKAALQEGFNFLQKKFF